MRSVVADALNNFRVVVVTGPRQVGKTTLVRQVLGTAGTLIRLDDEVTLQAAVRDPMGVATYGPIPRAFDEIQRAGDSLVRSIKTVVDDDRQRGQFLLNGSADFLIVPTISESLAGRAVFLDLWPFTQGEMAGSDERFLPRLFHDPAQWSEFPPSTINSAEYLDRICRGGYPEAIKLPPASRRAWFRNYVRAISERDIKELTGARRAQQLPKVLGLLAARTSGELVISQIHTAAGLANRMTTDDYVGYLKMVYLVHFLPAWSRNVTKKITRHPKIHLVDTGLGTGILGKTPEALARPTEPMRGPLFETFVVNEIIRQASWWDEALQFHHLRDRDGAEIDLLIETADGKVAAIEVKASSSVNPSDARWLAWLRDKIPDDFHIGIVFYTGDRPYSLGDRLVALPISYLWN